DVAVSFTDVFCSAKLDCGPTTDPADDLLFLHDGGVRSTTAVVGFACTSNQADTFIYMDPLRITCEGGSGEATVVDVSGLGVVGDLDAPPGANPDGYLFGAAVYRGNEAVANRAYWNVSLGLDRDSFAALGVCTLTGKATASRSPFTGFATPAGSTYPVIEWNVPLSDASGRRCTAHGVGTAGSGVAV